MLTIIYSGCEIEEIRQLIKRLTQETNQVHSGRSRAYPEHELEWIVHQDKVECRRIQVLGDEEPDPVSPEWYQSIAQLLTCFIFEVLEPRLLLDIIGEKVENVHEQDRLFAYVQKYLKARTPGTYSYTMKKIEHYLMDHQVIHIMGFIRFRLQNYRTDLQVIVESAWEDVLLDQQYDDFITLLKYYVGSQETKRNAIHLFHQDGNHFVVLDEEYQPLQSKEQGEAEIFSYEDMILNTIITASPETIYIHTTEPELQVIQTIQHIFNERAILCT